MMRTITLIVMLPIPFTSSFNITYLNPTRIKRKTEALVNILVESDIESIDNFSLLNTDGIPGYISILGAAPYPVSENPFQNTVCIRLKYKQLVPFNAWETDCISERMEHYEEISYAVPQGITHNLPI